MLPITGVCFKLLGYFVGYTQFLNPSQANIGIPPKLTRSARKRL
jgi:hypothetical protein